MLLCVPCACFHHPPEHKYQVRTFNIHLITARTRSTREGNVFTLLFTEGVTIPGHTGNLLHTAMQQPSSPSTQEAPPPPPPERTNQERGLAPAPTLAQEEGPVREDPRPFHETRERERCASILEVFFLDGSL